MQASAGARVYHVTDYGADPTGATDATAAINKAIADAFRPPNNATMTGGIPDLGGAEVHFDGGTYLIKGPLTLPASGGGNFKVKPTLTDPRFCLFVCNIRLLLLPAWLAARLPLGRLHC